MTLQSDAAKKETAATHTWLHDAVGDEAPADVLVVATKTPEVLAALQAHTRPEQLLLDVASLSDRGAHHAHYRGVCW